MKNEKRICTSIQFSRIRLPKPNKNDTRLATFRVAAKTENSAEAELPCDGNSLARTNDGAFEYYSIIAL